MTGVIHDYIDKKEQVMEMRFSYEVFRFSEDWEISLSGNIAQVYKKVFPP